MLSKAALLTLVPFVLAANDWSVPCTSGICEWDSNEPGATGSIILTSETWALSDLTQAAGWHILDCDSTSLEKQTIRLVCESSDLSSVGCDAVYERGVEDTVVRLPNSCAGGPFARLLRVWPSEDQSIPEETRRRFKKREDAATVQNAEIDFNFAAVSSESTPVAMMASGSNNPAAPPSQLVRRAYSSQKMRRGINKRGFFSDFFNFMSDLNKIDVSRDGSTPLNFEQNFPIAQSSVSCAATETTPAFDAGFNMNVDVNVKTTVNYGFVVAGTIIPPVVDDVGLYAALTGDASAKFNINAQAKATLDSGRIEVANFPLSPLSVPGIVNIGPSASLGVSGLATLGVTGNMVVGASLRIPKVEMRFPPKNGASGGDSTAVQSPLSLNINPEIALAGSLEAHIIPRLALGVDLIAGFANANVFLDLDLSGRAGMNLEASAQASTDSNPDTAVKGCVDFDANIAVRAGAEGSIAGIFDQSTAFDIFTKKFDLFDRCFGGATPAKRSISSFPATPVVHKKQKRALELVCPGTVSAATTLVDQIVG